MSALNQSHSQLRQALGSGVDVGIILKVLAGFFWTWYHNNSGDTIIKRKVLFFTVTIKVKDLRVLFISLFGAEPPPAVIS